MSSRSKELPDRRPRAALRRWARAALAALAVALPVTLAVALPAGSIARADSIDPSIPRVLAVGAPRGAAPSERLDPGRTGRARTRLPHPLVELWRRHITGGIEQLPVVDADDNILIALTVPEAIKLGPDGKEVWRVRLGTASPVAPPVLTSDGTLVVITAAGQAWGIWPNGSVRFTTGLGVRGRDVDTAPLALRDGGLVIASGATLIELDRDGAIRARGALEARPGSLDSRITGALLAAPAGDPRLAGATLFTTETGSVYSFRPPGAPQRIGTFGGFPRRGAALADARTLVAVVDSRRVVAFDLLTGTTHVRGSSTPFSLFDGPVAMGPQAAPGPGGLASRALDPGALRAPASTGGGTLALVALQSGLLVGLDAAGNEKVRVALEKPPVLPDPSAPGAGGVPGGVPGGTPGGMLGGQAGPTIGFFGPTESKPSPPLVVDPDGRIGFARANGRVGVISPEGNVAVAGERVCSAPVGVLPAGDKRMLLACRDGGLWLYGE